MRWLVLIRLLRMLLLYHSSILTTRGIGRGHGSLLLVRSIVKIVVEHLGLLSLVVVVS